MTNALFFISAETPVEGSLLTAWRCAGGRAYFYHVGTGEIYPRDSAPLHAWMGGDALPPSSSLRSAYLDLFITQNEITYVAAVGRTAAFHALRYNVSHNVNVILLPGELDFSKRRKGLALQFDGIVGRSNSLILADAWEMEKAIAHGSRIPHLRFPLYAVPGEQILSTRTGSNRIAIIIAEDSDDQHALLAADAVEGYAFEHGHDVVRRSPSDLYSTVDLRLGRGLHGTMRYRLPECTHAILIGDDPSMGMVLAALAAQRSRVIMSDTISNAYMAEQIPGTRRAKGAVALVAAVDDVINSQHTPSETEGILSADSLPAILESLEQSNFPWFYEELLPDAAQEFQVYFTVPPLENRSNGARPQRIRNMNFAMAERMPTVRLTSVTSVLERRVRYVEYMIEHGRRPDFFYGENSTSPMDGMEKILDVGAFMSFLAAKGAKISWFVRDLHWLDPDSKQFSSTDVQEQALIARGLFELQTIADESHVLLAPDPHSVTGFKLLLNGALAGSTPWGALPPGTSSTGDVPDAVRKNTPTLVYSGGVGGFYEMNTYLQALRLSELEDFYVDFVIRTEDVAVLRQLLLEAGLDPNDDRIRISTDHFQDFFPRTEFAIGVVLLDSTYAKFAFPYKTMSLVERGMPILTFSDMAIASFVKDQGVGVTISRDVKALAERLGSLAELEHRNFAFDAARTRNSWNQRVATAVEAAFNASMTSAGVSA